LLVSEETRNFASLTKMYPSASTRTQDMYLSKEAKTEVIQKHTPAHNAADTGSTEAQIALLSYRINHLTEHLKKNKHDKHTQRGLLTMVGKRRRLLAYLKRAKLDSYRELIQNLGLRR
jgi:small subunit ribosomal protein S15